MTRKTLLALTTLALGVLCSPTRELISREIGSEHTFDRRDVPMCGPSTNITCGMNVCCSGSNYCGTTDAHCAAGSCQPGYGSCQVAQPKKCGTSSGTTNGRSIGYYRGAAATSRSCDIVQPSDIDTSKFTHLYYAFANFDSSFNVIPMVSGDVALYSKFTALKTTSLQTWIAIGGAGNGTPWSAMVSSQANRAAFISSLISFMNKYGFQGVDLDWEVPQNQDDQTGYVALVKDMNTAFAGNFGISIAFPVDYGDMFWIDAKGMEPFINWFGFMAYDLKNPDGTVTAQTDILKIQNDALPLWFDGLDPGNINLGLASYGRGFTLADTSCNTLNCPVNGVSNPGTCIVDNTGVMALFDINILIAQKSLTPVLNTQSMFKQLTFADQWIGYDDAETVALKKGWGNDFCFGGTMQWTLDLGHF